MENSLCAFSLALFLAQRVRGWNQKKVKSVNLFDFSYLHLPRVLKNNKFPLLRIELNL